MERRIKKTVTVQFELSADDIADILRKHFDAPETARFMNDEGDSVYIDFQFGWTEESVDG